jgi:hypothetical protein
VGSLHTGGDIADNRNSIFSNRRKNLIMTPNQQEDLFIEWDLYEPGQQEDMITEYRIKFRGNYSKDGFCEFLAEKLEIKGYWAKMGLI